MGQCVLGDSVVFDFPLVAELQPVRRKGLGFSAPRRYDPRYAIFVKGLGKEGGRYSPGRGFEGRVQCGLDFLKLGCLIFLITYVFAP